MYINKVMLFGNLTRDPELRALPTGMNVASFSVATNRVFKDRDGKNQEQTDFHNVVVFGRQADTVSQYLKKGSSALSKAVSRLAVGMIKRPARRSTAPRSSRTVSNLALAAQERAQELNHQVRDRVRCRWKMRCLEATQRALASITRRKISILTIYRFNSVTRIIWQIYSLKMIFSTSITKMSIC